MNGTASDAMEGELVITRILEAPPSFVFKLWTEPEHLARWWGPEGFSLPSCEMDLRPGGAYRFCMRSPDGTEHRLRGVYREVVKPARLAFTWAWEDPEGRRGHETLVTVTFTEHGGKTRFTIHQAIFESVTARDEHQGGWASCLDRLAGYVAEAREE